MNMPFRTPLPQPTLGALLRRWRLARGLSQGSFGNLLQPKAQHSTVSCWENDVRRPSLKYLGQIIAITGIPIHLALPIPQADPKDTQS